MLQAMLRAAGSVSCRQGMLDKGCAEKFQEVLGGSIPGHNCTFDSSLPGYCEGVSDDGFLH